jgi:ectoine hydroxylase-related dioxygenase (phytanoyl-CoA dioxygenase family)
MMNSTSTLQSSATFTFAENPEAALESFHQLGYHIEPNVWGQQECDRLVQLAHTLTTDLDNSFTPLMQPHRLHPTFLEALQCSRIVLVMQQLLQGCISALQSEFFFCQPGTKGFSLHQDNYYVEAPTNAFASAWSALVDVTPEMGGLVVYPYSHREPILPVVLNSEQSFLGQDPNACRQAVVVPQSYQPVNLSIPRGSVVFLHGHAIHGSLQNNSNQFRYALLQTYIRKGESFRPGRYAQRSEVEIDYQS